jgi:hypothetical protein
MCRTRPSAFVWASVRKGRRPKEPKRAHAVADEREARKSNADHGAVMRAAEAAFKSQRYLQEEPVL